MKVCLAGTSIHEDILKKHNVRFFLESFYSVKEWQIPYIKKADLFLLDSGAFTFMNNFKGEVNWKDYIDKYADFIIKNGIKYFFELDIDVLIGYDKVKELTQYLENKVGRKCIPVWHKSRGIKEWERITREYNYVAIGGIVTKEIKAKEYDMFIPLLKIAKKNNCKVHGLGFIKMKLLSKYHFYSVDSTTWLSGGRFGRLCIFKNKVFKDVSYKDKRVKDYMQAHHHNIEEWIKFQEYADKYY